MCLSDFIVADRTGADTGALQLQWTEHRAEVLAVCRDGLTKFGRPAPSGHCAIFMGVPNQKPVSSRRHMKTFLFAASCSISYSQRVRSSLMYEVTFTYLPTYLLISPANATYHGSQTCQPTDLACRLINRPRLKILLYKEHQRPESSSSALGLFRSCVKRNRYKASLHIQFS